MGGAMARLRGALARSAPALEVPAWVWSLDYSTCRHASARAATTGDRARRGTLLGRDARPLTRAGRGRTASRAAPPRARTAHANRRRSCAVLWRAARGAGGSARSSWRDEVAPAHVDKRRARRCCTTTRTARPCGPRRTRSTWRASKTCWASRRPPRSCVRDMMVPAPELYTVANMSHLAHLGALTERTASPRCCSKTSQALLSILTRVTNAGSRGWETTLLAALKESEGAVRVCMQCLAVALSRAQPGGPPGGAPAVARALRAAPRAARADARRTSRRMCQRRPAR